MKVIKTILKGILWIAILVLLAAPIYLIDRISNEEMKQYAPKPVPVFRETAYGEIVKVRRMDVDEVVTVSGVCTSDAFAYMELTPRDIQNARWYVREGDEAQEGQPIALLNGAEILSEYTGVVREINIYAKAPYIKLQLFEPVEIECFVDAKTMKLLDRGRDTLTTEEGEPVSITFVSHMKNSEGKTKVRLHVDSAFFAYGTEVKELRILTGNKYLSALTLNAKCLYEKEPDSGEWYARRVTEDGSFLDEIRVEVGYGNGTVVCVSGVKEGDCFDAGYRVIAGDAHE